MPMTARPVTVVDEAETRTSESLALSAEQECARAVLMEAVFALDDEVQPNALDTQVSRLRRKLADAESGVVVNGVRGVGYLLREVA